MTKAYSTTSLPDHFIQCCSKCGEENQAQGFHPRKSCANGLSPRCKICVRISGKRYAHNKQGQTTRRAYRTSEHGRAILEQWYATDKGKESKRKGQKKFDTSEKGAAKKARLRDGKNRRQREHYRSEEGQAAKRAYRQSDAGQQSNIRYSQSEKGQQTRRQYRTTVEGRLVILRIASRYRARKRQLPDLFTREDEVFARNYWEGCCAICGATEGLWKIIVLDHWIPLSDCTCPGTVPGNLLPLCHARKGINGSDPDCNVNKRAKNPLLWLMKKLGEKKGQKKLEEIEIFFHQARLYAESLDVSRQREASS